MIRVGTWNVNGGRTIGGELFALAEEIRRYEFDVLGLQELSIPNWRSDGAYASWLSRATGYKHAVVTSLSPSHHEAHARLALALLSHTPLLDPAVQWLPNPQLTNSRGEVSHNKAILKALASLDVGLLEIACLHMVSFFHFGLYHQADRYPEIWEALSCGLVPNGDSTASIVMGDFNSDKRYSLIRQLASGEMRSSFSFDPSKRVRHLDDDILVSSTLTVTELQRIKTPSDHDLLRATVMASSTRTVAIGDSEAGSERRDLRAPP